jgi:hypothetical protein
MDEQNIVKAVSLLSTGNRHKRMLRPMVPCWPNASALTILLTGTLMRFLYRYFFVGAAFALPLIFVFEKEVADVLGLFGYSDEVVSSFKFLTLLYVRLASQGRIASVDVTNFHLLDAVLYVSIVTWGAWLVSGVIFLRQYDALFQSFLYRLTNTPAPRRTLTYFGWVVILSSGAVVTHASMDQKLLNDFEFIYVLNHFPRVYFFSLAVIYYYSVMFAAFTVLFVLWKVFRQYWPRATLWNRQTQSEG